MNSSLCRFFLPATVLLLAVALMTGCNRSYGYRIVSTGEDQLTVREERGVVQKTHEVAPDAKITLDGQPAELKQLDPGDKVNLKVEKRGDKEVATEIEAQAEETAARERRESQPDGVDMPVPEEETVTAPSDEPAQGQPGAPDTGPQLVQPENQPSVPAPEEFNEDPNEDPEDAAQESFEGAISDISVVDNQFVVTGDDGNEHIFTIGDDTAFTVDGEEAAFGDLQVDHNVKITAERRGEVLVAMSVEATSA